MFLMTQTLFPAPKTNRREIHIWDPLPAWPFPLPQALSPVYLYARIEAAQLAPRAQRRPLPTSVLLTASCKNRFLKCIRV